MTERSPYLIQRKKCTWEDWGFDWTFLKAPCSRDSCKGAVFFYHATKNGQLNWGKNMRKWGKMEAWKQNTNTNLRGTIHSPHQHTHVVSLAGCFLPSPSEGNIARYACSAEALILQPPQWQAASCKPRALLFHETGHTPSRAGHSGWGWLAPASWDGTPALSACREQGSQLVTTRTTSPA